MFHGFQSYPRRNIGTLDLLRPNPPMHPTSSSAVRLAVIYLQRLLLPICQSHTPQRHLHLHRQSHQLRARQQTRPPIAIHSNPLPGRSTIQIPTSFPIQEMVRSFGIFGIPAIPTDTPHGFQRFQRHIPSTKHCPCSADVPAEKGAKCQRGAAPLSRWRKAEGEGAHLLSARNVAPLAWCHACNVRWKAELTLRKGFA